MAKFRRTVVGIASAVMVLSAAAACGSSGGGSSSAGTDKIVWVVPNAAPSLASSVAVYAVAKKYGYFADEHLNVEINYANGSTAALQSVASGSADVAASDPPAIEAAREKGVDVKGFADLVSSYTWRMVVPPNSTLTPDTLKGKKIGIISLTSGSYPYALAYLNAHGLSEKDVDFIPVGMGPEAGQALESGQVDALALYTTPLAALSGAGVKFKYLDNPDIMKDLFGTVWLASDKTISSRKDVLTRFLRATFKALLFSSTNLDAALTAGYAVYPALLGGKSPTEAKPADLVALKTWVASVKPISATSADPSSWPVEWGGMTDDRWTAMTKFALDNKLITKTVATSEVWDPSLLKAANSFSGTDVVKTAKSVK